MGTTRPATMQRPLVTYTAADESPCVSMRPRCLRPRFPIALPLSAMRALVDGFVSSLAGGLVYCLILAYYNPDGLQLAALRVLAISLTFGGFEIWRAKRQHTPTSVRRCILWTLTASLLVFWALGAASSSASEDNFRPLEPLPHVLPVRLDPIA